MSKTQGYCLLGTLGIGKEPGTTQNPVAEPVEADGGNTTQNPTNDDLKEPETQNSQNMPKLSKEARVRCKRPNPAQSASHGVHFRRQALMLTALNPKTSRVMANRKPNPNSPELP